MSYISPPSELAAGSIVDTYLRDSGGENQDRSVESQLTEIKAYFKKHKLVLRRVYQDEARSGKTIAGRAGFDSMISDYESGDVPHGLILWDYARFARNSREAVFNIARIENSGVIIHSLTDNIPEGEFKDLIRLVKHMGNQAEREKNSAAVKRELHQLVKDKKAMWGVPPRGFKREPLPPTRNERTGEIRTLHKWIPNPEATPLILRAFEMRAQNKTLAEIINATGLYKSISCFDTFWTNKLYKGILEYGGMTIEDYCEPIVPADLWDAVNAMRKERKPGNGTRDPRRVLSSYLLSGLAYCQNCGGALTGHTIKEWSYYICSTRRLSRGTRCNMRYIPKANFEAAVFEAIKDNALSLETIINLQDRVTQELNRSLDDIERERVKLDRQLASAKKKIVNLTNAIANHGHSESLLTALQEVEETKASLVTQIRQLENEITIPRKTTAQLKEIAATLSYNITHGSDEEKRTIIRTFVTRILARREQNNVTALIYYLPIKIINPAERGLLGQAGVPPRGHLTEALITLSFPVKSSRVK